jgi:hypothetical protein
MRKPSPEAIYLARRIAHWNRLESRGVSPDSRSMGVAALDPCLLELEGPVFLNRLLGGRPAHVIQVSSATRSVVGDLRKGQ